MTLALYIVGGICWGSLVAYFTWDALRNRKIHKRLSLDSDPYRISERMRRRARALEREGITSLGHTRVGIDRRHP
jgi:hypothetical protein